MDTKSAPVPVDTEIKHLSASQMRHLQSEVGRTRQRQLAQQSVMPRAVRREASRITRAGRCGAKARARIARVSARTGTSYAESGSS